MYFYHVTNKGENAKSHWLLAKDDTDAIRIASTEKGVVDLDSLEKLKPYANINKLIKEGKAGLLAAKILGMKASDLIGGKKPKQIEDPWFLYKEV
jgi:hypothetical protein